MAGNKELFVNTCIRVGVWLVCGVKKGGEDHIH